MSRGRLPLGILAALAAGSIFAPTPAQPARASVSATASSTSDTPTKGQPNDGVRGAKATRFGEGSGWVRRSRAYCGKRRHWSVAQDRRNAAKARNVARNRKAHR